MSGITLDPTAIAELMILEAYFDDEFRILAGWLSNNALRDNIRELERQAGTPSEVDSGEAPSPPDADGEKKATKPAVVGLARPKIIAHLALLVEKIFAPDDGRRSVSAVACATVR